MDTTCSANRQIRTNTLNYEISNVGNEAKDGPSKAFATVNGTGTGHEA